MTLAALRFVLPVIVLAIWLKAEGRSFWLSKRDGWIAAGLGAVTAVYSWALLSAIGSIPLALAILIFYLFPLVATVLLGLFGWEKLGGKTIAAIVVAFVGLVFALDARVAQLDLIGMSLAFFAALGLGVVIAVSSRLLRTGDSRPVTLYMAAVSGFLLIALCALEGEFVFPHTTTGWLGFMAATLFYAFAMIAFFVAIALIGPTRSSLLGYVEPVVAAALGVIVLSEELSLVQISGIFLVVGALANVTVLKPKPKKS